MNLSRGCGGSDNEYKTVKRTEVFLVDCEKAG